MAKIAKRHKTYGLPYMGSKSAIAEWVVSYLPPAENFYDLFAGGCAITHAALLLKNYQHYYANDINPMPTTLFWEAAHGQHRGENRWISHEEFNRLKDTDAIVAYIWSFGNNPQKGYMYSRDIEPLKRAMHYAIYFADYEPMKAYGFDLSFLSRYSDVGTRYLAMRQYLSHQRKIGGIKGTTNNTRSQSCEGLMVLQSLCQLNYLEQLKQLKQLERLERLERLEQLEQLERLERLEQDYRNIKIRNNSVIYCDIPYEGTEIYKGAAGFDHAAFREWAQAQSEPVIISSYQMPSDFVTIAEISKRSLLCAENNSQMVSERLFVPRTQIEKGIFKYKL